MAIGTQETNEPKQTEKFEGRYRYHWQERHKRCILSILGLSGFRKEELKVEARDRDRSLTVSGQHYVRVDANKRVVRFSIRFLLSDICDLGERITATFNAKKGVLVLTMPKRVPPKATINVEDKQGTIKKRTEVLPEKDLEVIEGTIKATKLSEEELADIEETIKATKLSEQELAALPPEADSAEQPAATDKKQQPQEEDAGERNADRAAASPKGVTPQADSAAPASDHKEQADAERNSVHRERLLAEERAKRHAEQHKVKGRRTEEERASKVTAAPEEAKECQKTAELVAEELQGLAGSEWAEGLVEKVKKNKEVIAMVVAAFSLGLFVSCRLSSKH